MEKIENVTKAKLESNEKKGQSKKADAKLAWKSMATEVGLILLKGIVSGVGLRVATFLVDYSITRGMSKTTYTVIEGGRKSNNIAV